MPCTAAQLETLTASVGAESAAIICDVDVSGRGLMQAQARPGTIDAAGVGGAVDVMFMLFCAYLVFFMQAGFAMLCAGAVRSKNTMNILIKNVLDSAAGAISFYIFGFGFAYGTCGSGDDGSRNNGFIGCGMFALNHIEDESHWSFFLFQWAFAAAASTITVGSIAERTQFASYLAFSVWLTAFVYPVVAHWAWSPEGWLSPFKDDPIASTGMFDFAGCGVVHMVGGFAGLMGAWLVGPRIGRFDASGRPMPMPGHSATLLCLGTFILWFGWYGFNPGSALAVVGKDPAALSNLVARAAVTTTMSAAGGAVGALVLVYWQTGAWDLVAVCNGLLCGLVSITAGASVVEPWAAIIMGAIGAVIFNYGGKLLLKLRIDDPLEAVNMHAFCGMWGLVAVGFFAKRTYVRESYGDAVAEHGCGVFYGCDGRLLGMQILGFVVIGIWACALMFALFYFMKKIGKLRVSEQEEMSGLDVSIHGGQAYPAEHDMMKEGRPKI
ncbi:unnamed protein product [Pedinophyceae sp. YPF-701]|nr:unnamed protein product [Pedinophyceae sp. YPF-701]